MRSSSGLSGSVARTGQRVEDDGVHLRGPGDVGEVDRAELGRGAAAREGDLGAVEPVRGALGRQPLLVDRLALDPVGEAAAACVGRW